MKKILLQSVFCITAMGVVFCTLNANAQSRQSVLAKYNNIATTGIGNTHGLVLPYENPGLVNTLPENVKSGLDINSLIPIIDSMYVWEFDTLAGLWYLYPYQRMVDIVYDVNNNIISFVTENFNGAVWVNNKNYVNTYDINNNVATSLTQSWSGTAWVNDYLDTYTYDTYNNKTQDLSQNWNGTAWVNNYQDIYTYDASNNMTQYLSQNWSGTAWTNSSLYTYTYDTQNYETSEVDMTWTGSTWFNSTRSDYSYDANYNVTSILNASWNGIAWGKTFVITYTYDANNYKTTELDQSWNGSAWELVAQTTYLYDSHYNMTCAMIQKWGNSSWINAFKETFTYDANDFMQTAAFKKWNPTAAYINGGDSIYYYFHTVVGIHDITEELQNISVYPNPATTNITIESPQKSTLEILNMQGQIILQQQLQQGKTDIDISGLAKGVFILRLISNDKTDVTKFLKE